MKEVPDPLVAKSAITGRILLPESPVGNRETTVRIPDKEPTGPVSPLLLNCVSGIDQSTSETGILGQECGFESGDRAYIGAGGEVGRSKAE